MNEARPRIGVIKPCCIGDAVMALPLIDNIIEKIPSAQIEVWCGKHTRAVFDNYPGVSNVVEIPSVPTLKDIPRLTWRLRSSSNYGFFVLDRSRLIDASCRFAAVRLLGTVRTVTRSTRHETDCYLEALSQAGFPVVNRTPKLLIDSHLIDHALNRIGLKRDRFVVLHPGGAQNPGSTMHTKRWPAGRWNAVAQWLESRSIDVVLTGSSEEAELCHSVASGTHASIAAGKLSLMESAAIASKAMAYVGPDTGISHLAAAAGAPVIVIFGPTNPDQYAPRGQNVSILAPPGSYGLDATDLRGGGLSGLPTTADVSTESVIQKLTALLDTNRPPQCR